MPRDITAEPLFPLDDIQGDILTGLPKRHEHLMFFTIVEPAAFKAFLKALHVTSMRDCLQDRADIEAQKKINSQLVPTPGLNVAFTFAGLRALGAIEAAQLPDSDPFKAGMAKSQGTLSDPPASTWRTLKPDPNLHGVFVVTGASHAEVVDVMSLRLAPPTAHGWRLLFEEVGTVRPEPVVGHEHFGYADGVSQPGVRGRIDPATPFHPSVDDANPDQAAAGQDLLWPGEFVFGFPGQDPSAASFATKGPNKAPPVPFMNFGAYLVIRRLAQLVPEFNASVKAASTAIPATADKADPDLLGAQMIGRWKSGASIINAPTHDDRAVGDNTPDANNFEFGGDREGLVCPWAAHVRKTYPRDDVRHDTTPDETAIAAAEAFTQTHRMLRRGIAFGPEVTEREALSGVSNAEMGRGLLFKCYVTSIADQFEFVQAQWSNASDFSQETSGIDPIIGQAAAPERPFKGAAPVSRDPAKKPDFSLKSFVRMQGGAYFFAPSIPAMRGL
ncbi:Dyp-type peroxidase [Methylobacterium sp.]|jgi:Dyp-type peroxidase family|uniref:Dyp-type peroxidase n=1 Tax=Methylobacterium sp. TaxID=409 RepID=UPI00262CDA8A|nr:Dyp-type peroxidase [Methylobacterium sp.]MDB5645926.1 Dyp-type peroxidase [Methylobacterium sp.]